MAKTITGVVSSSKTDKTIVVTVRERKTHPLYRKQYTTTTKFMAHDEKNEAAEGDKVIIVETRPISKRKSFKLQAVVEKAEVKHVEQATEVPGVTDKAQKDEEKK
jgi:small subunit ribosomal protein S17